MLCTQLFFTGCSEEETWNPADDYPENILGGWYEETYQEYDVYTKNGVYYFDFPDNPTEGVGEYSIKNDIITYSFPFNGVIYSQNEQIISLSETEMIWKNPQNGEETKWLRVISEVEIDMSTGISILSIIPEELKPEEFDINDYEIIQGSGCILFNGEQITGFIEGTVFIKYFSSKGDVIIRVNITNNKNLCIQNLEYLIGSTKNDIKMMFGIPVYDRGDFIAYEFESPLLSKIYYSIDTNTNLVTDIIVSVTKENMPNIIEYYYSKYTFLYENNGIYIFINNDKCIMVMPEQLSVRYVQL